MPEVDLSSQVPAQARWIKLHYEMSALKPGAELVARVWSGRIEDAVVFKGKSGDVFLRLEAPQRFSYQRPVTVDLKLKLVAYKTVEEGPSTGV